MPLILITGIPSSGKTTRSLELKEYFEKRFQDRRKVEIISEYDTIIKTGYDKNTFYADSKKEKIVRSSLKSDLQRQIDTHDLSIFDGSNYIKGYRYEIYCMTKLYKTPQCTLHCDIPVEHAWLLNEKRVESERYNREIFDALVARYETPNGGNRWDAPLFAVTPEDELMYDEIYRSLYEIASPKPNQSTQCAPLAATNYLYELDRITQDVINAILSAKKMGINNDIKIPGCNATVEKSGTAPQLMRLRRQFLTYSKMQQSGIDQIAALFVQYLNKNL
ncbi:hypothetical protein DMN91_005673 [Ooceraea biroi]|uniref:Protein KTI12 homolog n=1 Tax=Ooceraea biroi TaxID=2015173 RepID=A0A026W3G6_OOCBI|nr:protein KTI12 homolog [Ooceraea biroi]EZA49589.1 KTI12-like protein [Ooceraea biroi]RLU21300.1 hypothetical protein DMN91_005673 [Ooceraea biroi]